MKKEEKRECELKYKIIGIEEENRIIEKINKIGFKYKKNNIESDYTPDVEGFLCRKNGLMLRFRVLEGTKNDVLMTLKIKGKETNFQDNYEIETLFGKFDIEKFNKINDILYEVIQHKIPIDIKKLRNISEIIQYLNQNAFCKYRMFTQKKRKEYLNENGIKITLDEFPKDIGKYIEIETETPEDLFKIVEMLELKNENIEKRNYGEIIKEKQKELPEQERRICVFNNWKH